MHYVLAFYLSRFLSLSVFSFPLRCAQFFLGFYTKIPNSSISYLPLPLAPRGPPFPSLPLSFSSHRRKRTATAREGDVLISSRDSSSPHQSSPSLLFSPHARRPHHNQSTTPTPPHHHSATPPHPPQGDTATPHPYGHGTALLLLLLATSHKSGLEVKWVIGDTNLCVLSIVGYA